MKITFIQYYKFALKTIKTRKKNDNLQFQMRVNNFGLY